LTHFPIFLSVAKVFLTIFFWTLRRFSFFFEGISFDLFQYYHHDLYYFISESNVETGLTLCIVETCLVINILPSNFIHYFIEIFTSIKKEGRFWNLESSPFGYSSHHCGEIIHVDSPSIFLISTHFSLRWLSFITLKLSIFFRVERGTGVAEEPSNSFWRCSYKLNWNTVRVLIFWYFDTLALKHSVFPSGQFHWRHSLVVERQMKTQPTSARREILQKCFYFLSRFLLLQSNRDTIRMIPWCF
jgi:hypothetical protein